MKYYASKKTTRKYYKYTYESWTQPIMTSDYTETDLGYVVTTCGNFGSPRNPYKALNGIKSGSDKDEGWATSNVINSWWQVKFPYKLVITGLVGYSKYDYPQKDTNTIGRFYTSSDKTTPIGDTYTNANSTAWNAVTVAGIPSQGITTDSIYFDKTGGAGWGGIGELEITATKQNIIEATADDYDFFVDEEKYKTSLINSNYYMSTQGV